MRDESREGFRVGAGTPTVATIGLLLLAFYIAMVAGRDMGLGPLDLETADHLALGLYALAPIVGGFLASRIPTGAQPVAVGVALLLGVLTTLFYATAVGAGYPQACPRDGIPTFVGAYFLGCLAVGGLVGGGMGLGLATTSWLCRRGLWLAAPLGGVIAFGAGFAGFNLFYSFVACLR
jgi:hypothetical protein